MTTEKGFLQETPSESLASGTDPVSEEQKALDSVGSQAQTEAQAYEQQIKDLGDQLRGLQGALDRTQKTVSDMQTKDQQAAFEQRLSDLPEDQQPLARLVADMQKEVSGLRDSLQGAQPGPSATAPDSELRQFVTTFGANPDDSRIDYAVLTSNRSEPERIRAFMDSVYAARGLDEGNVTTPGVAQLQAASIEPPTGQDIPRTTGPMTTEDDIITAFIEDRLPREEALRGLEGIGSPLTRLITG